MHIFYNNVIIAIQYSVSKDTVIIITITVILPSNLISFTPQSCLQTKPSEKCNVLKCICPSYSDLIKVKFSQAVHCTLTAWTSSDKVCVVHWRHFCIYKKMKQLLAELRHCRSHVLNAVSLRLDDSLHTSARNKWLQGECIRRHIKIWQHW